MFRIFFLASCLILRPGNSQLLSDTKKWSHLLPPTDVGPGLYLTPYIKAGELDKAKNLSEVTRTLAGLPDGDTQPKMYSGYLTVDEENGNNLLFWFVPATDAIPEKSPVVMWLQGGPGASSLYGFFEEIGPYLTYFNDTNEIKLRKNEFAWSKNYNLLMFDQPVGAGFSYTKNNTFPETEEEVADQLYEGLTQFFKVFHEFEDLPFFPTGESYAGKYVPAISKKIHDANNEEGSFKINLTGMAIGNGYTSPEHNNVRADFLYQLGMIGDVKKDEMMQVEEKNQEFIKDGNLTEAYNAFLVMLQEIKNMTGCDSIYDFTICHPPPNSSEVYVNSKTFREAFHIGNTTFGKQADDLKNALIPKDHQASQLSTLAGLVDQYPTMIYSGNFDIIVHTTANLNAIKAMEWSGQKQFLKKADEIFQVNNETAGYIRNVKTLKFVSIRNAGHMVPKDKPEVALKMLETFIDEALSYKPNNN